MPLHPVIAADLRTAAELTPYWRLPLREARAAARVPYLRRKTAPVEVAAVRELDVPGDAGAIRVRVYTPFDDGPHPLVVFFHGSGFTVLDLDTHDDFCRRLCVASGGVVASVDYRLAPEHPYPAGPADCLAATRWLAAHADDLDCVDGALGTMYENRALRTALFEAATAAPGVDLRVKTRPINTERGAAGVAVALSDGSTVRAPPVRLTVPTAGHR